MKRAIGIVLIALLGSLWLLGGSGSAGEGAVFGVLEAVIGRAGEQASGLLDDPGAAGGPSGPSSAKNAPRPPGAARAARLLADLRVAPAGSMAGYSREAFPHWAADGTEFGWPETDGSCDVRDDALIRDGEGIQVDEERQIYSGRWRDPYTGTTLEDPQDLDIEHVVPLANSYRSGADSWSARKRLAFANDPGVVLATDDGANQEKGDSGPEDWRPPNAVFHCEYAKRWIDIKSDWALSVNPAEKAALRGMLGNCATAR